MRQQLRGLCLVALAGLVLALALTGCGRRETPTAMNEPVAQFTINAAGGQFAPQMVSAPPGQQITFMNNDRVPHTVTPDVGQPTGGPNSDVDFPNGIQSGQSYTWTVPEDVVVGSSYYFHDRFAGQSGTGMMMGTGMAGVIRVSRAGSAPRAMEPMGPGQPMTPGQPMPMTPGQPMPTAPGQPMPPGAGTAPPGTPGAPMTPATPYNGATPAPVAP